MPLNNRIAAKNKTLERRSNMKIKCFNLKIQYNKLSKKQKQLLPSYFKEAKYFTNAIINCDDAFKFDYKTKEVEVIWIDQGETKKEVRNIILPSQIKQDIKTKIVTDITNLNKLKKKGIPIGKLKFRKEVNCIGLKQYGCTWKFGDKNKLHIAGIGWVRVNGKDQIDSSFKEFGRANLIRTASGYLIQVTCYADNNIIENNEIISPDDIIGLDFGIKDAVTLSNGEKINFKFDISDIVKAERKLRKKKKGSKNKFKQIIKVRKQYQKLVNKKNDATNKFVSTIKNKYKLICIQNDNFLKWQSGFFGKQIQRGILGRIKSKLIKLNTTLLIDRYKPSTKICPSCEKLNKLKLNDRDYNCECGFSENRDIKSAKVITVFGLEKYIPTEHRKFTLDEIATSSFTEKYKLLFDKDHYNLRIKKRDLLQIA